MAQFEVTRDGDVAELAVSGVVDARAAEQLLALLDELEAKEVVLDFTHVQLLEDVLLGALAEALEGHAHDRLHLRGLREHHLRLLQYLKLQLDEAGTLRELEEGAHP